MVQRFSLITKQHQPAYQPQKPSAEQGEEIMAPIEQNATSHFPLY
jgi:hypothetical protein